MARFLAQRDVGPWQERIAREELSSPAARSSPAALPSSSPDGAVERRGNSQLNADNLRMLEKQVATAGPVPPPAHLPPHQTLAKGLLQEEPGAFRLRFGRRPAPPRPSRQPPAPHPALVPNALGMPSAAGAAALVSGDSSSRRLGSRQKRRDGVDGEGRGPTSSGDYGRGAATVTGTATSHNRLSASSFVGPRGEASRADVERQLREQARLHEELVGNRGLAQPPSVGGATSQRQPQQHLRQLQFQQPSSRGGTGAAGSAAYRAGSSSQFGGGGGGEGAAMSAGEAAALAEEMEARVKMLEAHIAEERDSRDEVKERLAKLATLLEREAHQQQQPAAPRGPRPLTGGGGGVSGTSSSSRFAAAKRLPVAQGPSSGGRPPTGGAPKRLPTTLPAEPARQPPKVASSAPQVPSSAGGSRSNNGGVMTSSAAQRSSQHLTW